MESHKNLHRKGFTLVEILITIGLLVMIASLGLFISFDFYKGYSFRSERSTIVSVLQKARSQSMDNINEKRHGVHFQGNPLKYVIFECEGCTSYSGSNSMDNPVDAAYSISVTNPSLPFDVVFDQLTGDCVSSNCSTNPLSINISDSGKQYTISVNNQGRIDW
jgi:prepilin-type N-terminal cleavage/methylation domain-containing protein